MIATRRWKQKLSDAEIIRGVDCDQPLPLAMTGVFLQELHPL